MWKYWAVGSLYLAFLSSGITFNIIAPTLHDLQTVYNSSIGDISPIYTFRSAGYLFGTILGGFILNFFNRKLCLVVAYGLMAVTIVAVPFCYSLRNLFAVIALNGVMSGTSDVAANIWLLDMFKEKSGPYMQALYFFFAVGSSTSPLLSAPFLKENNLQESKIHFAYVVNGFIIGFSAIALFFVFLSDKSNEAIVNVRSELSQLLCNWKSLKITSSFVLVIVGFGFLTILVYSGFEICYFQFMPTLMTQSKLNISDTDAAFMNSAMNVAFTCFRGISIVANIKLATHVLIYFDLLVLSVATIVLFTFLNSSIALLYIGNILMGVGFSSIYPSVYAFVEQHIDITNFIGALFAFASGVTAIIYPPLIGEHIEMNPSIVLYLNVVSILLTTFAFVALHIFVATRVGNQRNNVEQSVALN